MESVDEIICPYCNHEDLQIGNDYDEGNFGTETCNNCGKEFDVECISVKRTFYTEKVEE